MLLTVKECAKLTGWSRATLYRRLSELEPYTELHSARRGGRLGAARTLFIDPTSLGVSHNLLRVSESQSQSLTDVSESQQQESSTRTTKTPECVKLTQVSESQVSKSQLARINIHSHSPHRTDKGRFRLAPEQYQLAVHGLVNNLGASTRMLHRILKRACDLQISESTLRRIRERLETDPRTRLMFLNADTRKEFLRTYAGQVFAPHANAMWQIDMTRCDILVWDEELGRVIRPRVHAAMDVYSGCYTSLVFSVREDQSQTDALIAGGLIPKNGKYRDAWPVFGTPEVIYMDNGKTYRSEHVHRYLADLGVEVIHSRPLTSHTRGRVERGFGTLHGYTKPLPGYCGSNAKERATEELKRLTKKP